MSTKDYLEKNSTRFSVSPRPRPRTRSRSHPQARASTSPDANKGDPEGRGTIRGISEGAPTPCPIESGARSTTTHARSSAAAASAAPARLARVAASGVSFFGDLFGGGARDQHAGGRLGDLLSEMFGGSSTTAPRGRDAVAPRRGRGDGNHARFQRFHRRRHRRPAADRGGSLPGLSRHRGEVQGDGAQGLPDLPGHPAATRTWAASRSRAVQGVRAAAAVVDEPLPRCAGRRAPPWQPHDPGADPGRGRQRQRMKLKGKGAQGDLRGTGRQPLHEDPRHPAPRCSGGTATT